MVDKTCEECLGVLSGFLDRKDLESLTNKQKENLNKSEFFRHLLKILCDGFPANYGAEYEDHGEGAPFMKLISAIASQIPVLFSSTTVLDVLTKCFQESLDEEKTSEPQKLLKIISEIVKRCRLTWLLLVNEAEVENVEVSNLEKARENIVFFLLSLLKHVDLMCLNSEQLKNHPKLNLYPRILLLCHSLLEKISKTEGSKGIPGVTLTGVTLKNFKLAIIRKVACNSLMACFQQTGSCYWASEISRKAASKFLELVVIWCGCKDAGELLSGSDTVAEVQQRKLFPNGILGNILQKMRDFMAKDKVSESPVAIHILVLSVSKVKHPFLGSHVSMILPPLLLLVDNYRVPNRVIGIQSLKHVIDNVNATELSWYGRAEVIYEALHHRVYTNEPEVMCVLLPCLLRILKVIEPPPTKPVAHRKMNKCDQNFQIILSSMEFESKIALRRAYCSHLVEFIDHMGITVLRHSKRLTRVVFRYLETPDGTTEEWRIAMLDVLKAIIINAWPRIPGYADEILRCLMKLIIDISTSCNVSVNVKQHVFVKIEECLLMLLTICGEPVKCKLEAMTTGLDHDETESLISQTLSSYKCRAE